MALSSAVVLLAAAFFSADASVGPCTNTSLCTECKECLEYDLVCKTDEYEVRHYSPTCWVSTDAEAYFMGVGAAMAFRRLFQYISGANQDGVKMEMMAPVLVKIPEETRMWEPAIYTLSFLLPASYQEKPPTPDNPKVYVTEMPEMDVYVRSYGGWMLSVTSRLHAQLLTKELERVRASYNHSYHYGVGYDSPLKLRNRHNEVWYVAEGEPVCKDPQEPTPPHTPRSMHADPTGFPSDAPQHAITDSATSAAASSADASTPPLPSPSSPSQPPPTSANMAPDLTTSNSSAPVPSSPSPAPRDEADVTAAWNSTAQSSVDTQAESSPVVAPVDTR